MIGALRVKGNSKSKTGINDMSDDDAHENMMMMPINVIKDTRNTGLTKLKGPGLLPS